MLARDPTAVTSAVSKKKLDKRSVTYNSRGQSVQFAPPGAAPAVANGESGPEAVPDGNATEKALTTLDEAQQWCNSVQTTLETLRSDVRQVQSIVRSSGEDTFTSVREPLTIRIDHVSKLVTECMQGADSVLAASVIPLQRQALEGEALARELKDTPKAVSTRPAQPGGMSPPPLLPGEFPSPSPPGSAPAGSPFEPLASPPPLLPGDIPPPTDEMPKLPNSG